MKRIFAASTIALTVVAGSSAFGVEPDHKATKTKQADKQAQKAQPKLTDFVEAPKAPKLTIGSKAPELKIAMFVKGDSVNGFESGQVYVVEFWATWCGPCIRAFPHLSELQADHGEKVKFIGVNIWEGVDDMGQRLDKVEKFVKKQGDNMSYTVAVEDGSAMADNWMRPAGQNGIPAAFIVDGTGHVAWIGHPATIDEPLAEVISGDFDSKAAAKAAQEEGILKAAFEKFASSVQSGKNLGDARQIADILIDQHLGDQPSGLNAIAWMILTAESKNIGEADYKIAHKAIAIACEKTQWKDWSLLDTYALAAFKMGQTEQAIKWQKKAIALAPKSNKDALAELNGRLAEYQE